MWGGPRCEWAQGLPKPRTGSGDGFPSPQRSTRLYPHVCSSLGAVAGTRSLPVANWEPHGMVAPLEAPRWLVCSFSAWLGRQPGEAALGGAVCSPSTVGGTGPAPANTQRVPAPPGLPPCSPACAACSRLPQSLAVPPPQTHAGGSSAPSPPEPQPCPRERTRPPRGAPAQHFAGATKASSCQNHILPTPALGKGYCS